MIENRGVAALAGLLFAATAAAAVIPEWRIGSGKRRLREGQDLLVAASRQTEATRRGGVLRDAEEVLEDAAGKLPYDVRPEFLLGSSAMLRGDSAVALDHYRRSLALEERPETDLNLSRAHMAVGDAQAAAVDAVRAVWLAPDLIRSLPEAAQTPVREHVGRLVAGFATGETEVPPLWPEPGIAPR
jgi:tetratricopeptide (TPR) repeat protein